jgi:hypothetical protein
LLRVRIPSGFRACPFLVAWCRAMLARGMPLRRHANRPTTNRLFPLTIAEVRAFVSLNNMQSSDGGKLVVVFLNPAPADAEEDLVAEFRPGKQLALFSVPLDTPQAEAEDLWRWVLSFCPGLAARRPRPSSGTGPVYAFLGKVPPLSVVERWYHFQQRKYRSTDKFTGGLNRKLLKVEEKRIN